MMSGYGYDKSNYRNHDCAGLVWLASLGGGGVRLRLWRRVGLAHTLSTPYPRWWYVGCMVVVMLMCREQTKMRLFCITLPPNYNADCALSLFSLQSANKAAKTAVKRLQPAILIERTAF